MMRKLFGVISGLILLIPLVALSDDSATATQTPEKVVAEFQKLPHHKMFCLDDSWRKLMSRKDRAELTPFYSSEFYRLFMWAQCIEPDVPPVYVDLDRMIFFDIRYGLHHPSTRGVIFVDNFRAQKAKLLGGTKAKVELIFDVPAVGVKNIHTTYTLIREDGQWKIDDIAPHGDYEEDSEREPALEHSDSIKTDMQNNYNAAEARYKQEQVKKR